MMLELISSSAALRLRFPDLAEFTLFDGGRTIEVRTLNDTNPETVRHLLLDQLLPRVLAHLGEIVLHAAAVRAGDRVIAFMGESGLGKSTLSAAFISLECQLLSDDGVVVTKSPEGMLAIPTYPSLRLWPKTLAGLYTDPPPVAPMAHYSAKQRVLFRTPPTVATALPLAALYVLSADETEIVKSSRLSPRAACMAIVSNCFQLDVSDTARAAKVLEAASAIACHVRVFSLRYPRDFTHLPEVVRHVLKQSNLPTPGCESKPFTR